MSVESEILRIQHNIANTYAAVSEKGGDVPLQPTSANLAAAVSSITSSAEIIAGDGLSKDGNTISVTTPVKGAGQAEYDALPEEQKQADVLYIVDEPPFVPSVLSVQEFDTEDGWHVRKWSSGHVEMILNKVYTVPASSWSQAGSLSSVPRLFAANAYPVKLMEVYSEAPVCFSDGWTIWAVMESNKNRLEQTQTARPVAINVPNVALEVLYTTTITGRWK